MSEREDNIKKIFEVMENALALAGYRLMDGDHETVIIRDPKADEDFQIRVEQIE